MRIAMLAPENSPSWGGVGAYIYNLVRHLPNGVEVHIITLDRPGVEDSYDVLFAASPHVHLHRIVSVPPGEVFLSNFKLQLAVARQFRKLHREHRFDVTHSHSGHLPHFFSQFQNLTPIIVTPHGTSKGLAKVWRRTRKRNVTESLSLLFSPVIECGTRISLKRADRLLPVSDYVLQQINTEYGFDATPKSTVVYNGVDTALFQPRQRQSGCCPTITFVGRFYSIKGFDVFCAAASLLLRRGHRVRCVLVGRGDTGSVSKALRGLPDETYSIAGRVSYHEMPEIYADSDIVVVPSRYEACPGVVMEAMSCGKVVVASRVGGIPEIIQDGYNGVLFRSEDSIDLADKIGSIIEAEIDIRTLGENARRTAVERFDWRTGARTIYGEYLKIAEKLGRG